MLEELLRMIQMQNNYEDRKVARYEDELQIIDTAKVTGSDRPFETAISNPLYNNGHWIVVEEYATKEAAKKGHDRWVKKMTAKRLPDQLVDVSTDWILKAAGIKRRIFKRMEAK